MDSRIEDIKSNMFEFNAHTATQVGVKGAIVVKAIIDLQENNIETTTQNICQYISFLSPKIINDNIDRLKKKKIIKSKTTSLKDIKNDVIKGVPKKKKCQWCNGYALVLHKHHYPIPKSKGGTETVNICPNCHYGFHYLENQIEVVE